MSMKIVTDKPSKVTLVVSDELNKLKGQVLAPKKLEEANKALSKLKMPDAYYEQQHGKPK
jgi:hypothetical protein